MSTSGIAQPPLPTSQLSQQPFSAYRVSPASSLMRNGRVFPFQHAHLSGGGRQRWEGIDKTGGFGGGTPARSGAECDPWTPTSGSPVPATSLSPPDRAVAGGGLGVVDGRGMAMSPLTRPLSTSGAGMSAAVTTPPLIPALPSLLGLSPDSPEYLGDLANALNSAPSPLEESLVQSVSISPPQSVGSVLFGGNGIGTPRQLQGGGVVVESRAPEGGLLKLQSTVRRPTRPPADFDPLADPSLDVDIQDICVDPDLNVDAPAFVPAGYLPG